MGVKHTFNNLDARPDKVEPGIYPATIKSAEEKVSKNGNDMIDITWELENSLWVYDHLVFTTKTGFKVDTFLKAIGKTPPKGVGAEVEIVADELVGLRAFIELGIEPAEGPYDERNKVNRYVTDKGVPPTGAEDNLF